MEVTHLGEGEFKVELNDEEVKYFDIEARARQLTWEKYLQGCIEVGRGM